MPTFTYSARNLTGVIQQGEIELPTREEVVGYLRRQKLIPVKVEQKKAAGSPSPSARGSRRATSSSSPASSPP
jgi:type II secretory pathway component PulF